MNNSSLARSLFAVGLIGLGLALMRHASLALSDATLVGTYCALVVSSVGAVVRRRQSAAWRGFALVGWAYFLPVFVFGSPEMVTRLPTNTVLAAYVGRLRPRPAAPLGFGIVERENGKISYTGRGGEPSSTFRDLLHQYNSASLYAMKIGHLLVTLLLACLGSILGEWMGWRRTGTRTQNATH